MMKPFVVAMTGASGTIYGIRLVQALLESGYSVELVLSDAARLVIREEQGVALTPKGFVNDLSLVTDAKQVERLTLHSCKDFTASIASGSYPIEGMVVVPCSMGTLGAIASGVSQNLIHRAADCALKENKNLVLVPRETPLSAIHLENMLKLSRAGAKIVPAMPGFYSGVENLEQLVDFMVGKILDQMNVQHVLFPRWTGSLSVLKEKLS